jgi:hypothetical protein
MIPSIFRWLIAIVLLAVAATTQAFCGFYVGRADTKLFNSASKVILVRDDNRTVISMLNDYTGDPKEFAIVVPVPQILSRDQIHIGDAAIFDRIDAFSAPRLAEYYDEDPCERRPELEERLSMRKFSAPAMAFSLAPRSDAALGVTVEATYTVGEYDIAILSAAQSNGLETWLAANGYRLPAGAAKALQPYVRQELKFFVARVNLDKHANAGSTMLRPLQFAFESPKFMLPIRLGMLNSRGPQDLIAFVLTRKGRVETTNYRTIRMPSGVELPLFTRNQFGDVYRALFDRTASAEDHRVVFTEYFWDMSWCDPCADTPLTPDELRKAGVFWLESVEPARREFLKRRPPVAAAPINGPVMLTRLHVRYTPETFPEDLVFQETGDQRNFQTRFVLRHPFPTAPNACPMAASYLREVRAREEEQATRLATLTGWELRDIRSKMSLATRGQNERNWWRRLWN